MKRLVVLATNNGGKVKEMQRILGDSFEVKTQKEMGIEIDPVEDGETFAENAKIKASALKLELSAQGVSAIVVADDSGILVDALPEKLGVYTARYSGDTNKETRDASNNIKLLEEMKGVEKRSANYSAVICTIDENGDVVYFEGDMPLEVGEEIKTEGNGFAFDFCCKSPKYNKYVCELTADEKDAISHRGEALRKMKEYF